MGKELMWLLNKAHFALFRYHAKNEREYIQGEGGKIGMVVGWRRKEKKQLEKDAKPMNWSGVEK